MTIAVIGAGVIGLSTAHTLASRGYAVRVYADSFPPDVTSNAACAIWLPFLMSDPAVGVELEEINEARRWAQTAWSHFKRLEDAACGIQRVHLVEVFEDEPPEPPYYASIVDNFCARTFVDGLAQYRHAWELDTYVIEMPSYLAWLRESCEARGVDFVTRRLTRGDLRKLEEPVLFNCAGLGARDLVDDDELEPIKGQILLLDPAPVDVSLGAGEFCVIPRSDALVLGSLFLKGDDTDDASSDGTTALLSAASAWAHTPLGRRLHLSPELSHRAIRNVVVGKRPYRATGPVVGVDRDSDRPIYHNYGHGGGGVTFSWGCAVAVVEQYDRSVLATLSRRRESSLPPCDVSIEVGHVEVDRNMIEYDFASVRETMMLSAERARPLIDTLVEQNRSYSLVTLFDDKTVAPLDTRARDALVEYLEDSVEWFGVDYVCFESQLVRALDDLLPQVDERTEEQLLGWKGQHHDTMACSHDIVTWYCLRLGLVPEPKAPRLLRPVSRGAKTGVS